MVCTLSVLRISMSSVPGSSSRLRLGIAVRMAIGRLGDRLSMSARYYRSVSHASGRDVRPECGGVVESGVGVAGAGGKRIPAVCECSLTRLSGLVSPWRRYWLDARRGAEGEAPQADIGRTPPNLRCSSQGYYGC